MTVDYDTILVPTDGSEPSHEALRHAVAIGERFDATVYVLAVVDATTDPLRFDVETVDDLERAAERIVSESATVRDDVNVRAVIRRGRPAAEIRSVAAEIDADLIVMGRTSDRTLSETVLGGTTDRVLRTVDVPVCLVDVAAETDDK